MKIKEECAILKGMIAETTMKARMLRAKLEQNPTVEVLEQVSSIEVEMQSHIDRLQYLERKWSGLTD